MVLEENGKPLPNHLGKVLGSFFESAIKNHRPGLDIVLRPRGIEETANFMILPPPIDHISIAPMRFGIMLYGTAVNHWLLFAQALLIQQKNHIHGHRCDIQEMRLIQPENESTFSVMNNGKLIENEPALENESDIFQRAVQRLANEPLPSMYYLTFKTPFRIASRSAKGIGQDLPWPTLGQILLSVAGLLRARLPYFANELGIDSNWKPSEEAQAIQPTTLDTDPARQSEWDYPSRTPRPGREIEHNSTGKPTQIRGITGTLAYQATNDRQEWMLLYWGQWVGVGQKTTAGFGSYALIY
jgi:hypothetical protein